MNLIKPSCVFACALWVASLHSLATAQLPESIPWDIDALRQPPKVEWLNQNGSVHSLVYAGEKYQGKPTRVFAYYASPQTLDASATLKAPGIVLVHGGGGTAFREWAELWAKRGYAAIAMDLSGHRPDEGKNAHDPKNRTRMEDGGPGQGDDEKFGSVDRPANEQWPYHAVANVVRAHSLLRSFPTVDGDHTAITGISWGGYLTCIVAGVDDRFKAAVPVYGCGFLDENSAWLDRFAKMSPDQRQRWVRLWDPSRYLPMVSMPILFVNGTNDFAYPLDSYMKSFDVVPGEKQLCITVNMPHGHPPGWARQEIGIFVDQHLIDGQPLLALNELHATDGRIELKVSGQTSATAAELHFSADAGKVNERQWTTQGAVVKGRAIEATLPSAEVTAWFITAQDERGAVVSSAIQFPSP